MINSWRLVDLVVCFCNLKQLVTDPGLDPKVHSEIVHSFAGEFNKGKLLQFFSPKFCFSNVSVALQC